MRRYCWFVICLSIVTSPAFGRWKESSIGTWESFVENLDRDASIQTPESLFAALPEELLSRYSLPWRSGGAEKYLVTPQTPRVILHGDSRQIDRATNPFVAFTHRSNIVELTFPSDTHFHPHVIEFHPQPGVRYRVDYNLRACYTCHTGSMASPLFLPNAFRPNWHTYPGWNGVYGERHEGNDPQKAEVALFQEFVAANGGRGIYNLPNLANQRIINLSHMNSNLSSRISYWNSKRILSHMEEFPDFEAFKPAIMAGASSLTNYLDFLPSRVVRARGGRKFVEALDETIRAQQRITYATYLDRLQNSREFKSQEHREMMGEGSEQTTGSFLSLYVLLTQYKGLPLSNLSTIFAEDSGGISPTVFDDPQFSTITLLRTLLMREHIEKLPADHPVLKKFRIFEGDRVYYTDIVTHLGAGTQASQIDYDSFLQLTNLPSPYFCARWIARAKSLIGR